MILITLIIMLNEAAVRFLEELPQTSVISGLPRGMIKGIMCMLLTSSDLSLSRFTCCQLLHWTSGLCRCYEI